MSYGRFERQKTKIIVPHLGGELIASHPFLIGTFFQLANKISKKQRPMVLEASSVLRYGYENEDDIAEYIRQIMIDDYGLFFNGILYVEEGAYIENNPEFSENASNLSDLIMNEQDLKSRLSSREEQGVIYSKDGLVRFVPYGFKIEEQTYRELEKNPFVIALAGPEGAENLGYIASQHEKKPCLLTPPLIGHTGDQPIKRVAGLDSNSNWLGKGLCVNGDNYNYNPDGFSFRVVRIKY